MPADCSDRLMRRLAAILVADVAGYARLMDRDEYGTHVKLRTVQAEIIEPLIALHGGRVVRLTGDGMLVLFDSATAALCCAIETQKKIRERDESTSQDERVRFRIGINVADILIDEREIAGRGVNVAARLEALASPGGICVSQALKDQVRENIGMRYVDAGLRRVKNISQPVRAFHVVLEPPPPLARLHSALAQWAAPIWRWWTGGAVAVVMLVLLLGWTQSESASLEATDTTAQQPTRFTSGPSSSAAARDLRIEISIAATASGYRILVNTRTPTEPNSVPANE